MDSSGHRIQIVERVDPAEWEELLASDPRALPFQHPRCQIRYLKHERRKRGRWIELRGEDGTLLAGLPFVISSRMGWWALSSGVQGTYGGPVARGGQGALDEQLLHAFMDWGGRRVVRRELAWGHAEAPGGGAAILTPIETALLDISRGYEVFWKETFSNNRRGECNRNEKRGLTVEESRDPRLLELFHPLYERSCRRWGIHALSLAHLQAILREEESALLTAAWYQERLVGLHFCFVLPDELFAWLGTSERLKRVFPSTALMQANVKAALARGLPRVNLGSSLGLPGVEQFKKLLGAVAGRRWQLLQEARWLRTWRRWTG